MMRERMPGLAVAASAALVAWLAHLALPAVPILTAAVALGIVVGQVPGLQPALAGALAPGLRIAARRLLRIGIVLLGLKLSLVDIAGLGWVTILTTVAVVVLTFVGTIGLGPRARAARPSAACSSRAGSRSAAPPRSARWRRRVRAKEEEQAVPIALVTLCGTLAIAVLPALWHPLGSRPREFGHWVGAGVHDVGQVVATAQIAGTAALAVAVVVKLTRVLMLAPMVAITAAVERRRGDRAAGPRPAIVPLFIAGFLAAVLLNTFVPLPEWVLTGADVAADRAARDGAVRARRVDPRSRELVRTGWRALVVGLTSWVLVAALALRGGAARLNGVPASRAQTAMTTLPRTAPDSSLATAVGGAFEREHLVDDRPHLARVDATGELGEVVAAAPGGERAEALRHERRGRRMPRPCGRAGRAPAHPSPTRGRACPCG